MVPVVVRGPIWVPLLGTVEVDMVSVASDGGVLSATTVVEVTVPGMVVYDTVWDASSVTVGSGVGSAGGGMLVLVVTGAAAQMACPAAMAADDSCKPSIPEDLGSPTNHSLLQHCKVRQC